MPSITHLPDDGDRRPTSSVRHSAYFSAGFGKPRRAKMTRKKHPNLNAIDFAPTAFPSTGSGPHFRAHPPLSPPKNLNVRSNEENARAAEIFKQELSDEEVFGELVEIAQTSPRGTDALGKTHFEDLYAHQFHVSRRHLRSLSNVGEDVEEKDVVTSNHLLIGQTMTRKPENPTVMYPSQVFPPAEEDTAEVHHGRTTTLFVSEGGCDIPMPRSDDAPLPSVSFDPDLPPLAAQHPTRVWNTMLHSLAPELQPLIKWEYDKLDEHNDDETGWIAHLTLILPPTHPAVAEHPLFYVVPKDRYSPEYVLSMETIGGLKTWTGQLRKVKTEAQNSALLCCIADNALEWVLRPRTAAVPEIEKESPDSDHNTPKPFPILLQPGVAVDTMDESPPTFEAIAEQISKFSDASRVTGLFEFEVDDDTGLCGSKLTVGAPPHIQVYNELCNHLTWQLAMGAVCHKAIDLNAVGFLQWLREEESQDSHKSTPKETATRTARSQPSDNTVNWMQQLDHFCKTEGIQPPRYWQRVEKRDGLPTIYFGLVTIEHDSFESKTPYESVQAARQDVACQVFVDYFGQDPVDL